MQNEIDVITLFDKLCEVSNFARQVCGMNIDAEIEAVINKVNALSDRNFAADIANIRAAWRADTSVKQ